MQVFRSHMEYNLVLHDDFFPFKSPEINCFHVKQQPLFILGGTHALHAKPSRFEERDGLSVSIVAAIQPTLFLQNVTCSKLYIRSFAMPTVHIF